MASLLFTQFLPPATELTFKVAASGSTTDAVGNVIPNSTTITHCVHLLSGAPQRAEIEQLAGMNNIQYPLRGIAPRVFPDSVKSQNPMIATCTWDSKEGTLQIVRRSPTGQEARSGEQFLASFVEG